MVIFNTESRGQGRVYDECLIRTSFQNKAIICLTDAKFYVAERLKLELSLSLTLSLCVCLCVCVHAHTHTHMRGCVFLVIRHF